jgi:hypothetical protein
MLYGIINANTFFLWALSYLNYKKYRWERQKCGGFGGFWEGYKPYKTRLEVVITRFFGLNCLMENIVIFRRLWH